MAGPHSTRPAERRHRGDCRGSRRRRSGSGMPLEVCPQILWPPRRCAAVLSVVLALLLEDLAI
eukprot:6038644-Prorocentrum_lima.AAC.1